MNQRNRFLGLIGVLLVIAAVYWFFSNDHSSDLVLVGTVDANQVVVSPKIAGRIEKLNVEEGSEVKQGDVIAVLDSAELEAQRRAAEASVSSMRSRVSQTQAEEELARGETSSGVVEAQAQVQAARAQLNEAQAGMERVRSDQVRMAQLAEQGIASKQERDRLDAELKAQLAHVASARDMLASAEAQVKVAQARTHQAHAAQSTVASTRAQVLNATAQRSEVEARLQYAQVLAPVSGTVSVRVARQGEVVNVGAPIVTLVDLSDTWVRVALPETYADLIALGDTLMVKLPSGRTVDGKVIFKGVEADFATQRDVNSRKRDIKTVAMKLSIDNSEKKLVPGMTAEVRIPKARLTAPRTAAEKK